ncbi:MAG: TrkH family potassium uptake protein [Spirochaetales bacterium]|nr:TrkH family potassium uptake protein [Spirochaetales bacterium]
MSFKKNIKLLAFIQIFIALLMLVPLGVSYRYGETKAANSFLLTIAMMVLISGGTLLILRKTEITNLRQRDGFFFVTLSWIIATSFGAIPLVLSGEFTSYSAAFFEIMSGFTTTGATTFSETGVYTRTGIEGCCKGILFWRSMTNWLGGMGIVVLFVALLPAIGATTGAGTFHLMGAESVGPVKGKLTPKTKTTAMALWGIYVGFSVLETIFLLFGGLSLYEAVTVTFSTIAAAGFCVKASSIGAFNSAYVDAIVTLFMLIAGANFSLYYKAFTGKIKSVLKDSELRWFMGIWFLASLAAAIQLTHTGTYDNILTAFRYAAFHVASVLTTTGFATTNYLNWPSFSIMVVVLMMFIGGCAGSAGGGMKVTRIETLCKLGGNTIRKRIHPSSVTKVRLGDDIIHDDTLMSIAAFCVIYMVTWLLGTVILTLTGNTIETCMAASILTLGNIGIGFGDVGPAGNFSIFPNWSLWVCSFEMLLGRLEIFTVLALFSRSFWKR